MCILPRYLILSSSSPSIIQEVACRLPSCWALTTAAGKCFWASIETGLTEKSIAGQLAKRHNLTTTMHNTALARKRGHGIRSLS
jgi:hypothetical protein